MARLAWAASLLPCLLALEVEVSLESSWAAAPLAAEMLDGLAAVGKGPSFLRALAANASRSEPSWREITADVANGELAGGGTSAFADFLSLRARHAVAAARVEASRGLERADRADLKADMASCPPGSPWASVLRAGAPLQVVCGAKSLESLKDLALGKASSGKGGSGSILRSSLDYVLYEQGEEAAAEVQVVGYVDLGGPSAVSSLLHALFALADALSEGGRPGWVAVRHGLPGAEIPDNHGALVGYGVELLARSADEVAKSADDETGGVLSQAAEDNASGGEGACGASDPAGMFHGLDLGALAQRHPQASPALCKLYGDLRAAVESPPPPWELKRLGAALALRAVQAAEGPGGGTAGLAAIAEVAQDFPSGWARALGGSDEGKVRQLMDQADNIQAGLLEINSWRVPNARRSILPILHVHTPIFFASELLTQAGFDPQAVVEVLRDARPGEALPDRIMVQDPRTDDKDVPVIYNVLTDPDTAQMRAQDREQDERQRGYYPPGAGALIRLVQFYGRFWSFPPPVPRKLLAVGLTVDLCSRKQLELATRMTSQGLPAVIWARLETSDTSEAAQAALEFAQKALPALAAGKPGAAAGKRLLAAFMGGGKRGEENLCESGAVQRLKELWNKEWKKAKATAPDVSHAATGRPSSVPFPSATINGRLVFGEGLYDGTLENTLRDEFENLVRKLSMQEDLEFTAPDDAIARWQTKSSRISVWHPALLAESNGPGRFVPVPPETLQRLPGAEFSGPRAMLAVHVLVFADPEAKANNPEPGLSALEEEGALAAPALFLSALSSHLASLGSDRMQDFPRRAFAAVAGGCAPEAGSSLPLAAALRRCLAAALPGAEGPTELASLARAMRSAAKGGAKELLQACATAAKNDEWPGKWKLRQEELSFGAADRQLCEEHASVAKLAGAPPAGAALLVVNGRQHGPIYPVHNGVRWQAEHFQLAESLELAYGSKLSGPSAKAFPPVEPSWPSSGIIGALQEANPGKNLLGVAYALAVCTRAMQELQALRSGAGEGEMQGGQDVQIDEDDQGFAPVQRAFREAPPELRLHLPPRPGSPSPLQIFASFDPLGQDAQRLPPLLQLLHEELNAEVGVILRPKALVANPLESYYRMALPPKAPKGGLAALGSWNGSMPQVRFSLPQRKGLLLSMQLNTPQAWLTSAVDSSGADLDSLRPQTSGTVQARYMLESLFVEGFADQSGPGRRGRPAAGRQLALTPLGAAAGRSAAEGIAGRDSVVVKSGYYQLRAPPGLYQLSLQSGVEGEQLVYPKGAVELADLAGRSTILHARVGASTDGTGTKTAKVAKDDSYNGAGGTSACKETIHIFSVASGHKYERLLRIMMLSVREHTKCPLRFWLVDNFLSPNFRRILPELAKKVGMAVSSVTYKWPTWLRAQTQKQRVIWAYKILFLDVFFPRQVERVLFIDADQIVRADVKELWETNLGEAVYGFVPFCGNGPSRGSSGSSWFGGKGEKEDTRNPDTLGFRFWEQGFWQKHLGNDRYYHISALFVVNLKLFRSTGAGDILRDVYQSLTEDPHSLANLDQDLPNYVQRDLPIFSLPPEWLWCESWCSNATKARAKTIDMCQHPIHKEGKLQGARRIAPEWVKYDEKLEAWVREIAQAQERAAASAA